MIERENRGCKRARGSQPGLKRSFAEKRVREPGAAEPRAKRGPPLWLGFGRTRTCLGLALEFREPLIFPRNSPTPVPFFYPPLLRGRPDFFPNIPSSFSGFRTDEAARTETERMTQPEVPQVEPRENRPWKPQANAVERARRVDRSWAKFAH